MLQITSLQDLILKQALKCSIMRNPVHAMNKKRAQVNYYDQLKIETSLICAHVPISIIFDDSRSRDAVTGKGD